MKHWHLVLHFIVVVVVKRFGAGVSVEGSGRRNCVHRVQHYWVCSDRGMGPCKTGGTGKFTLCPPSSVELVRVTGVGCVTGERSVVPGARIPSHCGQMVNASMDVAEIK